MIEIKYKLLSSTAKPFIYSRENDACMDVFASEQWTINYQEVALSPTGVAIELPRGYEGVIRGRSGLASKGILVPFGTIDEEYRGEIKVILYNTNIKPWYINIGDRIAQFAIKRVHPMRMTRVEELENTNRGEQGFGSSGV